MGRVIAQEYLKHFKRDTLRLLTDYGILRGRKDYQTHSGFVPSLYKQAELEMKNKDDRDEFAGEMVFECLEERSKNHQQAIIREKQRREDVKNEKIRLEEEAKKAKLRRQ